MRVSSLKTCSYFCVLFIGGYLASLLLLDAYSAGDQIHYGNYYNAIGNLSLIEAYRLQSDYLGSSELVYPAIAWIGAALGIDKIFYYSIWNASLITLVGILLQKSRSSWIFTALIFTNFYFLVLLTGAERLKISYIFLVLSTISSTRLRFVFGMLAPLAHFQSIINYLSLLTWKVTQRFDPIILRIDSVIRLCVALLCAMLISGQFLQSRDVVYEKIVVYISGSAGVLELFQILIVAIVGIIVLRRKSRFISAIAVIALFAFFLGGQRVNMIGVTMLIYFTLLERKTSHPLAICFMVVLSLKSVPFLSNIYLHGDGFYAPSVSVLWPGLNKNL